MSYDVLLSHTFCSFQLFIQRPHELIGRIEEERPPQEEPRPAPMPLMGMLFLTEPALWFMPILFMPLPKPEPQPELPMPMLEPILFMPVPMPMPMPEPILFMPIPEFMPTP